MKRVRRFLAAAAALALVLQAVRFPRNLGERHGAQSLERQHALPAEIDQLLSRACYDCHSDRTVYPWYANVQPMGWLIEKHVIDGKARLNFSNFARLDAEAAAHHFQEIVEVVERHEMPLPSYLWLHPEAQLSDAEQASLIAWAKEARRAALATGASARP